jgi:sialic acid synthase SpsE
MIEVILDVSANTFKNDIEYFKRMVDEIIKIDSKKYKIIFKTQLFSPESEVAKINKCLNPATFTGMYTYCKGKEYQLTSSVFDKFSLDFLLLHDIPFVKIACRPEMYFLIGRIPREIQVYISQDLRDGVNSIPYYGNEEILDCIPEYPAHINDYKKIFKFGRPFLNISDHTQGTELFNKFIEYHNDLQIEDNKMKSIFEMHYVLEREKDNPDSGPFAKTINELKEIL